MTKEETRQLIEKYDDGLTSNAEERALRQFFKEQPQEGLPEEWRVYKVLFAFVDKEIGENLLSSTNGDVAGNAIGSHKRRGVLWTKLAILTAACIATAVIVTATLKTPATNDNNGDYAVIDGKVVTDQRLIAAEVEAALQSVAYNDDDAFAAFSDL